jgi:hypothetical protein
VSKNHQKINLKKGDLIIDPYKGPGLLLHRVNLFESLPDSEDSWTWEVFWSNVNTSYYGTGGLKTTLFNERDLIYLIQNDRIQYQDNGGRDVV